ncbi:general substrate transporter [Xylogone sp. PMI_703]|nr:general substrate transporter [Xylogone sp. PMI_703]
MVGKTGLASLNGTPLVIAITSVCSSAFLLFGYDQGVMSGVVISHYWLEQMGNPSTLMVGTITALYDVGAVFGAILAALTAERLGRKRGLMAGAVLLIVGCVLMGSCVERIQMMFGRIFTGLGIGYITSVAPVYQCEICLPSQRGWHVSCQLTMLLFGLMLAYWINYGFYFHPGSIQWRFPLLFQIVFAVYILLLTPLLPDTPRWLMWHETSVERGTLVLSKLRGRPTDDPMVQTERDEIIAAIALEGKEQGSWSDLFRHGGCAANQRFYLAVGIQFMQQTSGINIVSYYAPTLFQESLGMSQERALFIGCFLQVWYLFASLLTWIMINSIGRRRLLISMAIGMCVVLVCEAICVAIGGKSAGIAAVFFVFAFEGCFTWGWMATVWVYPAEILPLKIRAKGAALAAAADYLGNFVVVEITPPALRNIGYKTYIIFAIFNIIAALIIYCFYPETAYLNLESIDLVFVPDRESNREVEENRSFYQKMSHADIITRADIAVKHAKADVKRRRLAANGDIEPGAPVIGFKGPNELKQMDLETHHVE